MTFLNLFPIPRRYERIPGTLAFTLAAALTLYYIRERSVLSVSLLGTSLVLLAAVYLIRFRQKEEWSRFFEEENRCLLGIKGADGADACIVRQRSALPELRNPELKLTARLNLCTALLAAERPAEALEELNVLKPERMPNPTLRLVYWTQLLEADIALADADAAEKAYQSALSTVPEVSDMLKISFMPAEIRYRLFRGEYKHALDQLNEIPDQDLNEESSDLLLALRAAALRGVGAAEKADRLTARLEARDLLPSTRALLHRAGTAGLNPPA